MKSHINLLPLGYRRRQLIRRALGWWSCVWLTCLTGAAAAYGLACYRSGSLEQEVTVAESSAAPLLRLQQEQAAMQKALNAALAKGTVLGQVQDDRPPLSLLGAVSQSARRCGGRLDVQHLGFERKDREQTETSKPATAGKPPQPAAEKHDSWGQVTIRGNALDNLAVATFVAGLRDSGLFRNVELKSCVRASSGGKETRSYVLECEI